MLLSDFRKFFKKEFWCFSSHLIPVRLARRSPSSPSASPSASPRPRPANLGGLRRPILRADEPLAPSVDGVNAVGAVEGAEAARRAAAAAAQAAAAAASGPTVT